MNEQLEIVSLMRAETELAEPPSGIVNVERAMTAGRRQRWYGRAAGAVLAAVILVTAAVTVPQLLRADGPPGFEVALPRDIPALPTLGASAAAPTVFDPSVAYLTFGWVPADYHERGYQVGLGPDGQTASLQATPPIPDEWRGVSVTLYPRGVTPPPPQREDGPAKVLHTTPASAGDQDATWTTYRGASSPEVFLSWRYAPRGWARVRVAQDTGDVSVVALRVAQMLRLSGSDRLSLPFRMAELPGGLRPIRAEVDNSTLPEDSPWYAGMSFSSAPAGTPALRRIEQALTVSVTPYRHQDTTGGKGYSPPTTTIDGHPANRVPATGPASDLTMYGVAGVNVEIDAGDPGMAALLGPQGCLSVYEQKVTLAAGAAAWTTGLQD
jgi:hypothetical protein